MSASKAAIGAELLREIADFMAHLKDEIPLSMYAGGKGVRLPVRVLIGPPGSDPGDLAWVQIDVLSDHEPLLMLYGPNSPGDEPVEGDSVRALEKLAQIADIAEGWKLSRHLGGTNLDPAADAILAIVRSER